MSRGFSKLSERDRQKLILNLCYALCTLRSPEEVAKLITDLFTPQEVDVVAKRLRIAELLVNGSEYLAIKEELKVGNSTIARVNTWLNLAGDGFKMVFSRKKKPREEESESDIYDPYSWRNIKRRYTSSFWPQLLLEEIMKSSDENEKKKISEIIKRLDVKGKSHTLVYGS